MFFKKRSSADPNRKDDSSSQQPVSTSKRPKVEQAKDTAAEASESDNDSSEDGRTGSFKKKIQRGPVKAKKEVTLAPKKGSKRDAILEELGLPPLDDLSKEELEQARSAESRKPFR